MTSWMSWKKKVSGSVTLRLINYLSKSSPVAFWGLCGLMTLCGGLEFLSIGAVVPFLGIVSGSSSTTGIFQYAERFYGKDTEDISFVVLISIVFIVLFLVATFLRLVVLRLTGLFSAKLGTLAAESIYRTKLVEPYEEHIKQDSSKMIMLISIQIDKFTASANAILEILAAFPIAAGIVWALCSINIALTLGLFAVASGYYLIIAKATSQRLSKNSNRIAVNANLCIKYLQESFRGMQEIRLYNLELRSLHGFKALDESLRISQANSVLIGIVPRYTIETIFMILLVASGLYSFLNKDQANIVQTLGVLAVGAQRLLPNLQGVYGNWSRFKGYSTDVKDVLTSLEEQRPAGQLKVDSDKNFEFSKEIRLKNVSYKYDKSYVLKDINISIKRGEKIAIIGPTGSGKSTLINLVMGTLTMQEGELSIDGTNIYPSKEREKQLLWQKNIAYVSQNPYIVNATIEENIALGCDENVDLATLRYSARAAQIYDYIRSLPMSFKTPIGENGINLSGGQKQRLAIARALYRKPMVLILDEPTSALDVETESRIIERLDSLGKNITIIVIAHRLNTIRKCDRIFRLSDGSLDEVPRIESA